MYILNTNFSILSAFISLSLLSAFKILFNNTDQTPIWTQKTTTPKCVTINKYLLILIHHNTANTSNESGITCTKMFVSSKTVIHARNTQFMPCMQNSARKYHLNSSRVLHRNQPSNIGQMN